MTEQPRPGDAVDGCVFCQIAAGRIPSVKIYEDAEFISFMDIAPQTEGHFLIVPRAHYESLLEMPEGLLTKVLPLAQKLASAALTGLSLQGFNLLQNNGEVAGQAVPHWHLHVIPRRNKGEIPFHAGPPADLTKLPRAAEHIRLNIK